MRIEDIDPRWVEKAAHVLLHGYPLIPTSAADTLARAVLEAVLPDVLVALNVVDEYKPGMEGMVYAGAINSDEDLAEWRRTPEEIREEAFRVLNDALTRADTEGGQ